MRRVQKWWDVTHHTLGAEVSPLCGWEGSLIVSAGEATLEQLEALAVFGPRVGGP